MFMCVCVCHVCLCSCASTRLKQLICTDLCKIRCVTYECVYAYACACAGATL